MLFEFGDEFGVVCVPPAIVVWFGEGRPDECLQASLFVGIFWPGQETREDCCFRLDERPFSEPSE